MDNKLTKEDNSDPKNGNSTIRESLINTAVQFLQNPKTRSSPLSEKKNFLKKKGMSDEEIEIAVQRSGIKENYQPDPPIRYNNQIAINPILPPPSNYHYLQHLAMMQYTSSRVMWMRDLANSIVTLGGAAYIVYWFYKKFIEPFLFGRKKKEIEKDPIEVKIIELKEGVERVNTNVERLEQKLEFTNHRNQIDDQELITHITTLKGLLLNRKQFPATPVTSVTTSATIPAWQLTETQTAPSEDNKKLDNSPSSSSNNSTTNGANSDSSLEVIRDKEINSIASK